MQILGFRDDFAARQDKLHQEFYNVPTKEWILLVGINFRDFGDLRMARMAKDHLDWQIWGFSLNIP